MLPRSRARATPSGGREQGPDEDGRPRRLVRDVRRERARVQPVPEPEPGEDPSDSEFRLGAAAADDLHSPRDGRLHAVLHRGSLQPVPRKLERDDCFRAVLLHQAPGLSSPRVGLNDVRTDPRAIAELARRERIWAAFQAAAPDGVASPAVLARVGIRPKNTGQGVFRDQDNTSVLASEGVTLSILEAGTTYPDAFDDDAGEYHYPATKRTGARDQNEILATDNARRFELPIFVVLPGPRDLKLVRRGWVERSDDRRRVFLISFSRQFQVLPLVPEEPFVLAAGIRERRESYLAVRPGQNRFRHRVLHRCDGQCVACGLEVDPLLEAAHLRGVEEGGSDDPRNGLALCRNHHRAFDSPVALFGIEPSTLSFVQGTPRDFDDLRITRRKLEAKHAPHPEALEWSWARFKELNKLRPHGIPPPTWPPPSRERA